jgi:hypothetical protein
LAFPSRSLPTGGRSLPRRSGLLSSLGIKSIPTTPYHPQANDAVERFHRRLKESLRARLAGADWPSHLPWVLLGLRAAPREDSGVSATELVYGCPLSLPGQFLTGSEQPPASFVCQLNSSLPCVADNSHRPSTPPAGARRLQEAAFVYVRAPPVSPTLAPVYRGPHRVLVPGDKYFVLEVGGQTCPFSASNLKPNLGQSLPSPASAPWKGRPRRSPQVLSLTPGSRLGGVV